MGGQGINKKVCLCPVVSFVLTELTCLSLCNRLWAPLFPHYKMGWMYWRVLVTCCVLQVCLMTHACFAALGHCLRQCFSDLAHLPFFSLSLPLFSDVLQDFEYDILNFIIESLVFYRVIFLPSQMVDMALDSPYCNDTVAMAINMWCFSGCPVSE